MTHYINTEMFDPLFAEVFWKETMATDTRREGATLTAVRTEARPQTTPRPPAMAAAQSKGEAHKTGTLRRGQCTNCGKRWDKTWRRDPATRTQLCNACGLYIRTNRTSRTFYQDLDGKCKLARQGSMGGSVRTRNRRL